ncbi:Endo/exonuclease/phosphatase domain-containing protein [Aphelenchoides fujianensis]|nr:Endo/exonuclease/phosphatase domain-containing protein [Aphelenchoides fujianensis]
MRFHVATLNCWLLPYPWPLGSKDRVYRLERIAETLKDSDYDVVALQEVWADNDFAYLVAALKNKFPFSHYFHSGFTGSGTCVFSAHKIVSTLLHRYSLNGFAHHVHRGDWFGGKIVGMVELDVDGLSIAMYTTHLHAEYNRENDLYLPHRIAQAFELGQFVRHTAKAADFIILAGDFNIEPEDLGYSIVRNIGNLYDAWESRPNRDFIDGMTCDRPDNSYTPKSVLQHSPHGKRLDYIMYQSGKGKHHPLFTDRLSVRLSVCSQLIECTTCFNEMTEPKHVNLSDHIGVRAEFELQDGECAFSHSFASTFRLQLTLGKPSVCLPQITVYRSFLEKSLSILDEGEVRVLWDRRLFLAMCVIGVMSLILTFNIENVYPSFTVVIEVTRFLITLFVGFCIWHGRVDLTIELKALQETKHTIRNMLDADATE